MYAGGFAAELDVFVCRQDIGQRHGREHDAGVALSNGSVVANFTDPGFAWMLTAQGSAGYNPMITDLQFTSRAEANYTISNVWIGDAAAILPPTLTSQGDFNHDGVVNKADYVMWRNTIGQTGSSLVADGDGNWKIDNGDFNTWRAHYGQTVTGSASGASFLEAVPEPPTFVLVGLILSAFQGNRVARRREVTRGKTIGATNLGII